MGLCSYWLVCVYVFSVCRCWFTGLHLFVVGYWWILFLRDWVAWRVGVIGFLDYVTVLFRCERPIGLGELFVLA